jgi:hypothetical protein
MSWTSGYISEIPYTYGYYRELSPSLLRLACLNAGFAAPSASPLNYLELGYGQGLSINIHAATTAGEFWGTDFIPAQAAHARALASVSRSGARLLDDSFADFAVRTDLPEFDIIALHGTWSWVSDENRRTIVDIVRRRLRVGGLLYLSYNCFPGWSTGLPVRHLMALHAELAGAGASVTAKVDNAIAFAQNVVAAGAFHFRVNSAGSDRLKAIAGQDRAYLAHEYFNRDWEVMPFSDVVRWLDDAKLTYVTSARLLDHFDAINLTAEWQKLLGDIPNPILRQTVRDYLVNQQFRRDIFIKGPRPLSALDRAEALRAQSFVLTTHPGSIALKVTGNVGEIELQEQVYRPLIDALAQDAYAPKTLADIANRAKLNELPFEQLISALLILVSAEHVHPAQDATKQAREHCAALNRHLCQHARGSGDITFLASPVTGGGVTVQRFQQLFLSALKQGRKSAADQAAFAWSVLSAQGQRLVRGGQMLATAEDNLAELTQHAQQFANERVPLLKALGIVDDAGEPESATLARAGTSRSAPRPRPQR